MHLAVQPPNFRIWNRTKYVAVVNRTFSLKIIVCISEAKYCQISVKNSPQYRRLQRATQEPTLKAVVMYEFLVKLQHHSPCVMYTAAHGALSLLSSAEKLCRQHTEPSADKTCLSYARARAGLLLLRKAYS
jgi:hypothetical protein